MKRSIWFFCVAFYLLSVSALVAQVNPIPNPGFETWSSGSPTGWLTNNAGSVYTTVTQSTDFHGGASSAQGAVVMYLTVNISPTLFAGTNGSGFPVSTRYATLSGYYKYTSVGGDSLAVIVVMSKNHTGIGGGLFGTAVNKTTYTLFTATITYANSNVPDTAMILISIVPPGGQSQAHVGSTFKIDDLAFSGVNGVEGIEINPQTFSLSQNYPNPFNPSTTIEYNLSRSAYSKLAVYNSLGQEVAVLGDGIQAGGTHRAVFDGKNLPSGLYTYRLISGELVKSGKMVMVK